MIEKLKLLALTPQELEKVLTRHFRDRGEPDYRVGQVTEWIYQKLAPGFQALTNLPLHERQALEAAFSLDEADLATLSRSSDGTVKHLWRLADGELVESVLIPADGRMTLCISSQAGCGMGCTFCATGFGGLRRNLSADEIVAQYRASQRWVLEEGLDRIGNVVFMGMGEPLANQKGLFPALSALNEGYGVGARRITVSTVGLVPGILALAQRPEQFRLALSLHAPNSGLRRTLVPLEERFPLPEVLEALRTFQDAGGKRITLEYTLIRGVNDFDHLAPELAEIALDLRAFVNLIPFNPIPYQDWEPSPQRQVRAFARILEGRGVAVAVREPRGRDIDAACGQLRANALRGSDRASGGSQDRQAGRDLPREGESSGSEV